MVEGGHETRWERSVAVSSASIRSAWPLSAEASDRPVAFQAGATRLPIQDVFQPVLIAAAAAISLVAAASTRGAAEAPRRRYFPDPRSGDRDVGRSRVRLPALPLYHNA